MQERARYREAWRRHRPPERLVPFELVVRRRGRWRWLMAGLGAGMVAAGFVLLWTGKTVNMELTGMVSWLRAMLHELRMWACC